MPKVTGYKLREALQMWSMKCFNATQAFEAAGWVFPGESRQGVPQAEALKQVFNAEAAMSKLQTYQAEYNSKVNVVVGKESMTLLEAVKTLGGAGRIERLLRVAGRASPTVAYRETDKIYATREIPVEKLQEHAQAATKYSNQIRMAIAAGNAVEVEISTLDLKLFE